MKEAIDALLAKISQLKETLAYNKVKEGELQATAAEFRRKVEVTRSSIAAIEKAVDFLRKAEDKGKEPKT